jgi:hypothetical protein
VAGCQTSVEIICLPGMLSLSLRLVFHQTIWIILQSTAMLPLLGKILRCRDCEKGILRRRNCAFWFPQLGAMIISSVIASQFYLCLCATIKVLNCADYF